MLVSSAMMAPITQIPFRGLAELLVYPLLAGMALWMRVKNAMMAYKTLIS